MKRFLCLLFLLLPLGALSQPIIRHALTTNSPSVMTNVVKSMGTGVVATASLNGANITAGTVANTALNFIAATNGGPVSGANITAGTTPNTALNFVAATNGGPLPAANLTGSISDARLSANVPLLNAANVFTASNTFPNVGVTGTLTVNGGVLATPNLSTMLIPYTGSGILTLNADITNFTVVANSGTVTGTGATGRITNTVAGYYMVNWQLNIGPSGTFGERKISLMTNGVASLYSWAQFWGQSASGIYRDTQGSTIINLPANTGISLQMTVDSFGGSETNRYMVFSSQLLN